MLLVSSKYCKCQYISSKEWEYATSAFSEIFTFSENTSLLASGKLASLIGVERLCAAVILAALGTLAHFLQLC